MSPERDDFQDDDERDEFASRSIFAAGWFRAVLVLTVLAIVVVISLPYLLNWFEPAPPPRVARPADTPKPVPPVATAPAVTPTAPATPSPATPPPPATAPAETKPAETKAATPPPAPAPAPKAVEPKAAEKAPAPAPKAAEKAPAPAPKVAEKPASAEPPRKAVAEKPAPKVVAEKPQTKPAPKAIAEKVAPDKSVPEKKTVAEKAPASAKVEKAAPTRVAKAEAPAPSRPVSTSAKGGEPAGGTGKYWIQLGAFKEQNNADTLAKNLRDAGFPVQVTPITRGGAATAPAESRTTMQQHELFVTETSVEKVNASLKGRGTAQAVSGGVAVRPAFSLQEAMSVSKRLTDDGLKVVIRPAGGPATPTVAPNGSSGGATGGTTLHAVRVGSYPNRTSALAARDELAAKGHPGFLAEGPAK